MKNAPPALPIFIVIILEGFVVLASELLAIRQTIPYVGSGTDTVAIIIAAVLMPLACGYYAGGQFKPGFVNGRYRTVRGKLIRNIMIALLIYVIGLSYPITRWFFSTMVQEELDNRLLMITIYSALFLVTPVYLLGQTIPLISNYFSKEKLSQITGKILFFSTLGSFLGAVLTTIVLMSTIGVHYTNAVVFFILAGLVVLLSKKKLSDKVFAALGAAFIGLMLNSGDVMKSYDIVENNKYNTIMVLERNGSRHLSLNNNASSMFNDAGQKHVYIEFMEQQAIIPILDAPSPKNILVIGAGGFTFGFEDTNNHYDFVDIDESLKNIAVEHLLKQELTDNKEFHPMPARAFLTKTDKLYDVIVLDVFQGDLSIPEHLITQEFFQQMKGKLSAEGIVMANFTTSPNFQSRYSRIVDNTWRSVFPFSSRHILRDRYMPWNNDENKLGNAVYIYRQHPGEEHDLRAIYTDNKNTSFIDRPKAR